MINLLKKDYIWMTGKAEQVREHDRTSVQRAVGRGRGGRGRGDGGVVGGHHASGASFQEEMAEQDEKTRQANRKAQHRHRGQRASVLGEIRPLLRGGAQRGQAQRWLLRHGPGEGRGDGR